MRRETRFTAIQPQTWKRVYERDNHRCVRIGARVYFSPDELKSFITKEGDLC